MFQQL
ncbi:Uncharacterized protein LB4E_2326 [Leptospira borgpetersenii str. 4E]